MPSDTAAPIESAKASRSDGEEDGEEAGVGGIGTGQPAYSAGARRLSPAGMPYGRARMRAPQAPVSGACACTDAGTAKIAG